MEKGQATSGQVGTRKQKEDAEGKGRGIKVFGGDRCYRSCSSKEAEAATLRGAKAGKQQWTKVELKKEKNVRGGDYLRKVISL